MKYIGHSVAYYNGNHGYKLMVSDDGAFYSVYFDAGFPVIRILTGKHNVISGTAFRQMMDDDDFIEYDYTFNPDTLVDSLVDDLRKTFKVYVGEIV